MATELMDQPESKIKEIIQEIRDIDGVVIAFSGGVDSSTVAALAHRALGDQAVACTAVSETLPEKEYREAIETAEEIGIRHELVTFSELSSDDFVQNDPDRCYHCRSMRLSEMLDKAREIGFSVVADGTNASDTDPDEHRPGLRAVEELEVYSPLLRHGVDKDMVREIARELGLSVWDKPSMACLSSRIPHGTQVTEDRLMRIEQAESVVREYGFTQFRVRDHDDVARVEISRDELQEALDGELLMELHERIKETGFEYVTLDMAGYRSSTPAESTVD